MQVKSWMFRENGEHFALFLCLLFLSIVGLFFSLLTFWGAVLAISLSLLYVQLQQAQYLGNAVQVTSKQFPQLYKKFQEAKKIFEIQNAQLFIVQDPSLNAFCLGIQKCSVILNSALVESMNEKELFFIIAHELGHYKTGHTKVSSLIVPIGQNTLFTDLTLGFWKRKTELTADKAALVVTHDIDSAITALTTLAIGKQLFQKMDMTEFIHQIKEADEKNFIGVSQILSSHPHITVRIKNLVQFWHENFKTQSL